MSRPISGFAYPSRYIVDAPAATSSNDVVVAAVLVSWASVQIRSRRSRRILGGGRAAGPRARDARAPSRMASARYRSLMPLTSDTLGAQPIPGGGRSQAAPRGGLGHGVSRFFERPPDALRSPTGALGRLEDPDSCLRIPDQWLGVSGKGLRQPNLVRVVPGEPLGAVRRGRGQRSPQSAPPRARTVIRAHDHLLTWSRRGFGATLRDAPRPVH